MNTKLAAFLNKYPNRNRLIEDYTDSVGRDDFNHGQSERQPDALRSYLMRHRIPSTRLPPSCKREALPDGDNSPATNGQKKRSAAVIRKH